MKSKLTTAMGKMNGRELGMLFFRDMVGLLTEGTEAYTLDEFTSLLTKADHRNRTEFLKYQIASSQLAQLSYIGWWTSALIRKNVLAIEALLGYVTLACVGHAVSKMVMLERLRHDLAHDDADAPWESEIVLREGADTIQKALLGRKADMEETYNCLNEFIKIHLAIAGAMAKLADVMDIPEIASIPNNPIVHVESLNKSIRDLEDPYREIFPEIDIDSLKPSQSDIDEWVTRVSGLIISGTA